MHLPQIVAASYAQLSLPISALFGLWNNDSLDTEIPQLASSTDNSDPGKSLILETTSTARLLPGSVLSQLPLRDAELELIKSC